MIIIIGAALLGIVFLIWLWKGPVTKLIESMKADGSSTLEAYFVAALLFGGAALVIYMVGRVI